MPSEKEVQSNRTSTAIAIAAVHWAQPMHPCWLVWTSESIWTLEKVYFVHDGRIYKIRGTCSFAQQGIWNCGKCYLWKMDLQAWLSIRSGDRPREKSFVVILRKIFLSYWQCDTTLLQLTTRSATARLKWPTKQSQNIWLHLWTIPNSNGKTFWPHWWSPTTLPFIAQSKLPHST